ncbi:hypothetical protein GCM10025867_48020 (plasmid) [Frondihabitans sucicola]|uniref:SdpI family protein n=1 Tax=Frondihabitans sucicola TaxID=1268041 RepID=A0ABM8GVR6_9MICO|nr:hypothetical protein [Frondihabitans sucicola]BDZ52561.1 hypothetical protein GCM10025867_48020 [Frondihabitans sucicola]
MELFESLWLAIFAVPIGIGFTFPSWLLGRLGSFINPGGTQRLWLTRTSLNRWMGFIMSSILTLMLAIGLKTTGVFWLAFLVAVFAAASYFYAFMLGLGARDWKTVAHEADRTHLQAPRLDEMDHELISMIDEGRSL